MESELRVLPLDLFVPFAVRLDLSFVSLYIISRCCFDEDTDGGMRATRMQEVHLIGSFVRVAVVYCYEDTDKKGEPPGREYRI